MTNDISVCALFLSEHLCRDIKIKSRAEFEEDFDGIKELIAAKTLFMVDDKISMFEEVRKIRQSFLYWIHKYFSFKMTSSLQMTSADFTCRWWHHQPLAFSCWFSIVNSTTCFENPGKVNLNHLAKEREGAPSPLSSSSSNSRWNEWC